MVDRTYEHSLTKDDLELMTTLASQVAIALDEDIGEAALGDKPIVAQEDRLMCAGLAGGVYGHYIVLLSPQMLDFSEMAKIVVMVVIGGLGSILGAMLTGLGLGLIEGLTKVVYPEASTVVVFVIMALALLLRPAGLFGREA